MEITICISQCDLASIYFESCYLQVLWQPTLESTDNTDLPHAITDDLGYHCFVEDYI